MFAMYVGECSVPLGRLRMASRFIISVEAVPTDGKVCDSSSSRRRSGIAVVFDVSVMVGFVNLSDAKIQSFFGFSLFFHTFVKH